jgi:hypothetical protein
LELQTGYKKAGTYLFAFGKGYQNTGSIVIKVMCNDKARVIEGVFKN